ncbi:MAG: response regulator [Nanoarchaeota archaeon]
MAKILYFEDNDQFRELMKEMLGIFGYDVDSYSDPTKFLARSQQKENIPSYKLLITDVDMPYMDGITFVRDHINKVGKDVPVLILTGGNSEEEIREAGIENFHYLEKPVNMISLEEKIKKVYNLIS